MMDGRLNAADGGLVKRGCIKACEAVEFICTECLWRVLILPSNRKSFMAILANSCCCGSMLFELINPGIGCKNTLVFWLAYVVRMPMS